MLTRPEPACLLIADISGYTRYLAGTELDHAQDILADLMTTVVGALRPGFRLAKLEGDAAFAYALAEVIDGSALLDTVERTYFAFRRRLRDIANATSCRCNACVLMPRLDLKVIVHHGSIVRHRIAGREELVGSDVIVAHRMLKNHVIEATGIAAYALFSEACVAAMTVDPAALGMREHREAYDDLDEMGGFVHDLGAAWAAEQERRRVVVPARDAPYVMDAVVAAPLDLVWMYMTDPSLRPTWQADVTAVDEQPTAPRRGVGTTNHCMHGDAILVEEILDWRPTELVTHRTTMPNGLKLLSSFVFEAIPEGTHVRVTATWGKSRKERDAMAGVREVVAGAVERGQANLRTVIALEMARRAALAADEPPEPETPASLERQVREPVAG